MRELVVPAPLLHCTGADANAPGGQPSGSRARGSRGRGVIPMRELVVPAPLLHCTGAGYYYY